MDPTFNFNKKKQKLIKRKPLNQFRRKKVRPRERILSFYSYFLLFIRFTEFRPSEFVGSNTKSALRDEGYAWDPKTRDFTENSGKNSEKS